MSTEDKVAEILGSCFGTVAEGPLTGGALRERVVASLRNSLPAEEAQDLAYHLSDWHSDAAFLVAVSLQPERFTDQEIRSGVRSFLIYATPHILEACRLSAIKPHNIFAELESSGVA